MCTALLVAACSDDDNGTTSGAAGGGGATASSSSSSSSSASTGGSAGCTYDGFTAETEVTIESDNGLRHQGLAGFNPNGQLISIEMVYSFGADDQPHTFDAWENYATCHTCIILGRGCTNTNCTQVFEVQSGTLEVTTNENGAMLGQFAGSLTNAEAVEVTIDPGSLESTPVEDGERWCIDSYVFDVMTIMPSN